jgi:hypothetical protein
MDFYANAYRRSMAVETGITLLQQRRIEAGILDAVYAALTREFSGEKALAIIASIIRDLAFQRGRELRVANPSGALSVLAELWNQLGRGGALDIEILEQSSDRLRFRVHRCGYADAYSEMGISPALGAALSCSRDEALLRGYSDSIMLECSKTIMEGARYCEFTYRLNRQ